MRYLILVLMLTSSFSQELEVEGDLKVSGEIDASQQRIKNVGNPTQGNDAVTLSYVNQLSSSGKSTIVLKCPWLTTIYSSENLPSVGSCEPPECPIEWIEIAQYNETSGFGGESHRKYLTGNSCRICQEENEE